MQLIRTSFAITIGALITACSSQALANAFDNYTASGRAEHFGINYPEIQNLPGSAFTPSSHHRFGSQTGIGSSTAQTESATVESMPQVQYTPTAVSPAIVAAPAQNPTNISRFRIVSPGLIQTPALTPTISASPNLRSIMSAGTSLGPDLLGPSPSLGGSDINKILQGRGRGSSPFGSTLINPLEGL